MSERLTNNQSHTLFWLVIAIVAAAFIVANERNFPEPHPAMNNKPIADATDTRSDTLVANRKIIGDESHTNLRIPFSQLISTARVNDLLVDTRGTLWVATENGICSINNGKVREFSENKGTFSAPQAECLAFDGQKLWVGTFFGLFSMTRSGRIEKHIISTSPGSEIILDLYYDGISLWVGTFAGVAFMDKDGNFVIIDSIVSNGGMRNDWCQKIMRFSNWFVVAHDSGISFWNTGFKASNPEFWKNIDNARSGIIRPITGMTFDGKHLWIATARGILYLTTPLEKLFSESVSNFVNFTKIHGLPDNRINAIISHRGSIWVATNGGLARINDDRIQTIVPADGSSISKVNALAASGDILWLGTDHGVQFINTAMVE